MMPRMQFDAEKGTDQILKDITEGVNKFVFVRGIDQEKATEMRAIVLVAGRGYKRRLGSGAPVESLDRVREDLHGMVRAQLVDIEQILTDEEWENVISGFKQSQDIPEHMKETTSDMEWTRQQLRRLFPNASELEVEEAARKSTTLETAVQMVMDSAWAPAAAAQMPRPPPRPRKPTAPPAPGEGRTLVTGGVNSGASAFGLFFDLLAYDQPLTVLGLSTAASPMLAYGPQKTLSLSVYGREGTGQGREEDAAAWTLLAHQPRAALPIVSWMDVAPEYGHVPFDTPLHLNPGERKGLCVRTNSLNGIVVRMNDGKGVDTDGMDEDFGGGASDDDIAGITARAFRAGEISDYDVSVGIECGWTATAAAFGQEPACMPVVAAFVGALHYRIRHPDPA